MQELLDPDPGSVHRTKMADLLLLPLCSLYHQHIAANAEGPACRAPPPSSPQEQQGMTETSYAAPSERVVPDGVLAGDGLEFARVQI